MNTNQNTDQNTCIVRHDGTDGPTLWDCKCRECRYMQVDYIRNDTFPKF